MQSTQSNYNEIHLTFEEEKFRDIYKPYYENLHLTKGLKRKIHIRAILLFAALSVPFYIASIFNSDWVYIGSILLVIALYQVVRMLLNKKFYEDVETKSKNEVDEFVKLTRDKKTIKYQYDDTQLEYIVDGKILGEPLLWDNATSFYCDGRLVMVYFDNPLSEIMLPKSMTRTAEFDKFIRWMTRAGIPDKSSNKG